MIVVQTLTLYGGDLVVLFIRFQQGSMNYRRIHSRPLFKAGCFIRGLKDFSQFARQAMSAGLCADVAHQAFVSSAFRHNCEYMQRVVYARSATNDPEACVVYSRSYINDPETRCLLQECYQRPRNTRCLLRQCYQRPRSTRHLLRECYQRPRNMPFDRD